MIKAIDTFYNGYKFRSRLEARWAVFFDTIGFKWKFEVEGYSNNEIAYLPDFWVTLPNKKNYYCEVKPEDYHLSDDGKEEFYRQFVKEQNTPLILLTGQPDWMAYEEISPPAEGKTLPCVFFQDYEPFVRIVDSYWLQYMEFNQTNGHLYFSNHDERDARKSFGDNYVDAVFAACRARFEHKEGI